MRRYTIILVGLCSISSLAQAADIDQILNDCSQGRSHVEMTECLQTAKDQNAAALASIEATLLDHLAKRDEGSVSIVNQKTTFQSAKSAYGFYQEKQCDFYRVMADGGNSAHDLTLACFAAFDEERTSQLKWALDNWK